VGGEAGLLLIGFVSVYDLVDGTIVFFLLEGLHATLRRFLYYDDTNGIFSFLDSFFSVFLRSEDGISSEPK
jgi:hypothetical protein